MHIHVLRTAYAMYTQCSVHCTPYAVHCTAYSVRYICVYCVCMRVRRTGMYGVHCMPYTHTYTMFLLDLSTVTDSVFHIHIYTNTQLHTHRHTHAHKDIHTYTCVKGHYREFPNFLTRIYSKHVQTCSEF